MQIILEWLGFIFCIAIGLGSLWLIARGKGWLAGSLCLFLAQFWLNSDLALMGLWRWYEGFNALGSILISMYTVVLALGVWLGLRYQRHWFNTWQPKGVLLGQMVLAYIALTILGMSGLQGMLDASLLEIPLYLFQIWITEPLTFIQAFMESIYTLLLPFSTLALGWSFGMITGPWVVSAKDQNGNLGALMTNFSFRYKCQTGVVQLKYLQAYSPWRLKRRSVQLDIANFHPDFKIIRKMITINDSANVNMEIIHSDGRLEYRTEKASGNSKKIEVDADDMLLKWGDNASVILSSEETRHLKTLLSKVPTTLSTEQELSNG